MITELLSGHEKKSLHLRRDLKVKELWCYNDRVLVECPELCAIVNRENLLVTVLVGVLLLGNMPELAGDVLGIICLMGIVSCRKIIYLQLCGLVGMGLGENILSLACMIKYCCQVFVRKALLVHL